MFPFLVGSISHGYRALDDATRSVEELMNVLMQHEEIQSPSLVASTRPSSKCLKPTFLPTQGEVQGSFKVGQTKVDHVGSQISRQTATVAQGAALNQT
jgi:hypothetical protein